jgi:hypothetical protein
VDCHRALLTDVSAILYKSQIETVHRLCGRNHVFLRDWLRLSMNHDQEISERLDLVAGNILALRTEIEDARPL